MPPRAGKSYVVSLFCAWMLGRNPTESIMRNTCTATLYDKFSYDVRAIVLSMKYREVFPELYLSENKKNLDGWNTHASRQVGYFGAGVGGTIIGFGATLLAITDDLYKSLKDALSPGTNRTVHQWKESAHDSRKERTCRVIDIGTRWTKQDIIGKGIETKEYDMSIVVPALQERKNEAGEMEEVSFCEDVKTTEQYIGIRNKIMPEIWNAEYMQQPIELTGLLFYEKELKRFKKADIRRVEAHSVLGYIDPADEGTDFFSFPLAYLYPRKVFVTDVVFTRDNNDIAEPRAVAMVRAQQIYSDEEPPKLLKQVSYIRVETNGGQSLLVKSLRKQIAPEKILPVNNSTSKHTRILDAMGFIKEYFYFLDKTEYAPGSDYDLFLHNLLSYMKDGSSENDDAPDSLAGLAQFAESFLPRLFKIESPK